MVYLEVHDMSEITTNIFYDGEGYGDRFRAEICQDDGETVLYHWNRKTDVEERVVVKIPNNIVLDMAEIIKFNDTMLAKELGHVEPEENNQTLEQK